MPTPAIETHALTKVFAPPPRFGRLLRPQECAESLLAVNGVNLSIEAGQIFGLVGPNGAGKTTLVKMLCTLILPTSGEARIHGIPLARENAIKRSIGLMTGNERHFYWRLTGRENLRFYAGLHSIPPAQSAARINELAELLGLGDYLDRRFDSYSTGMKHSLALACSLLHRPTLLFLDEPTRSLDPLAAARFRQVVQTQAREEQRTVFLVTHDLHEAIELCNSAAVMVKGRLHMAASPAQLRGLLRPQEHCRIEVRDFDAVWLTDLPAGEGATLKVEEENAPGRFALSLSLPQGSKAQLSPLLEMIEERGGALEAITFTPPSWDEIVADLQGSAEAVAPTQPHSTPPANVSTPATASTPPLSPHISPSSPLQATPSSTAAPSVASTTLAAPTLAASARAQRSSAPWLHLRARLNKPLLFLRRDFLMETSYRFGFLLQLLGILFSTTSFYFISQLLTPGVSGFLDAYGGNYFSFVLIGMAFTGYQSVALTTFSSVIRSGQVSGTLEALLITPTRLPTVLLSSSLWEFLFTTLRVAIYLAMGVMLFGASLENANVFSALVILGLTVLVMSGIGILSASFIMVLKRGDPVSFVFSSLSTLLGGVYYPVSVLPGWLQLLAQAFPLTHALEAMRRALLSGATLVALWREVVILTGFAVVLLPLSMTAFRRAVRLARRDGTLTQF